MKLQRTTSEEDDTNIELYNELLYQHSPITIFVNRPLSQLPVLLLLPNLGAVMKLVLTRVDCHPFLVRPNVQRQVGPVENSLCSLDSAMYADNSFH